jgi:mannose-6-phosphate isomerase-like protein (cupin superfamily)
LCQVNDSRVKLVKLKGEFLCRQHENEDQLFLVVNGKRLMKLRDREAMINAGEFLIAPQGGEHCPVAEQEAHMLLIEPKGAWNTGNVRNEKTLQTLATIRDLYSPPSPARATGLL